VATLTLHYVYYGSLKSVYLILLTKKVLSSNANFKIGSDVQKIIQFNVVIRNILFKLWKDFVILIENFLS